MTAASETDLSLLQEYDEELQALREHPHNVLIEGAVAATEAALVLLLQMYSNSPIVWNGSDTRGHLGTTSNTLVLRNPSALCPADQRRLLESLTSARCRLRVISTSEEPLFAQVEAGHFDAALYYRLNVVLLRVDSSG